MTSMRTPGPLFALFTLSMFLMTSGCGDPLYESVEWDPGSFSELTPTSTTSEADTSSADKYAWPMTRDGYVVARPVPMAFVTAPEKKIAVPDPATAKVKGWSEEGLGDSLTYFLKRGLQPPENVLKPLASIESSKFAGVQAFDLSIDGTRLVVIDQKRLAMYKCEDGSLLGHRPLPAEVTSGMSSPTAIRFCGKSKDMLVASQQRIIRISSSDGAVVAKTDGIGEPIKQWFVNDADTATLMLGESGKIYGGDSHLESFAAHNVGKDLSFDTVSLSPDGGRIGVVVDQQPRIYLLRNNRIIDQIDCGSSLRLDPNVSIVCGNNSDSWADGDGIAYRATGTSDSSEWTAYRMLWKPTQISMIAFDDQYSTLLCVGTRVANGRNEIILYDHQPMYRGHSVPQILQEVPDRFASDREGGVVAICDRRGLSLVSRPVFYPHGMVFVNGRVSSLLRRGEYSQIVKGLEVLRGQRRLIYGVTSEEIRTAILQKFGEYWAALQDDPSDHAKQELKDLQQWREQGSVVAATADGIRHYRLAWNSRGSGYSHQITAKGGRGYEQQLELAMESLGKALQSDHPPLIAFQTAIQATLEQTGKLEDVDTMCGRACQLYPGELLPHGSVAFKLLPQWFGEPGDALSYVSAVSRMYESPQDDLLYMRLVAYLTRRITWNDAASWRAYDPIRTRRGLDELIRRGGVADADLWSLWINFAERTRDIESAEVLMRHLMETTSTPPWVMTHGNEAPYSPHLDAMAKRIADAAK